MIDRVAAARSGGGSYEVPVGFKWFVDGPARRLARLRRRGERRARRSCAATARSWTTDKDGIILGLLAAEITRARGRDPGALYAALARELGEPVYERIDAPATPEQKARSTQLSPEQRRSATELAGEPIAARC